MVEPDDEAVFRDVVNSMSQESYDKHIKEILEAEAPRIRERQEARRVCTVITSSNDDIDESNDSRQNQAFVDDEDNFEQGPEKLYQNSKPKNKQFFDVPTRINRWSSGTLDGPLWSDEAIGYYMDELTTYTNDTSDRTKKFQDTHGLDDNLPPDTRFRTIKIGYTDGEDFLGESLWLEETTQNNKQFKGQNYPVTVSNRGSVRVYGPKVDDSDFRVLNLEDPTEFRVAKIFQRRLRQPDQLWCRQM